MKIRLFFIFVFLSLKGLAQDTISVHAACDFLKNLHFTNGTDTIVIRVNYYALYSQGAQLILKIWKARKS